MLEQTFVNILMIFSSTTKSKRGNFDFQNNLITTVRTLKNILKLMFIKHLINFTKDFVLFV